ncbi:MAG: hypothetical protein GX575_19695 [Candidatus Anammoximicrobium sp.]|nr:hypothetical protein [Candidatus Anammoximicrobium sp.]
MTQLSAGGSIVRDEFTVPWGDVPELTPPRRRYVQSHFAQRGLDASRLDDASLRRVFSRLARVEEYASHLFHNGHNWELDYACLERRREGVEPVIDLWAADWAARGLLPDLPGAGPRWPHGKRFALCLTHDMDTLRGDVLWNRLRSLRHYRAAPLHQQAIAAASTARALARRLIPGRCPRDPLLSEWLAAEDQHGFRSSFFFLAQPLPEPDWEDSFDAYGDRVLFEGRKTTIREAMRQIAAAGWDVGLHGSSRSHASARLLAEERRIVSEACGEPVLTIRQHHLFFNARFTPAYQEQAGLRADSSVGSNLRSGFRCGTGLPFFWYDLVEDRELEILQAPLIIQDVALFRTLRMDADTALRHCTEILRQAAGLGAAVTILWHNNWYAVDDAFVVYRTLLEEASSLGAWGCSLRELSDWWRQRRARLAGPKEVAE